MQSSTGELQDMNGGRDEEGGDEHSGRTEPELALCVTPAWSPQALVQTARSGRADHVH